ncbi:hypothetical protein BJF78_14255 [Pseudonocardia sp. CNS-139]|nr:hypothetical protein BJF78_14255 [Pseudonocardia sp. CNS-139]
MTTHLWTPELTAVVDGYRTCELATLNRAGVPVAWPVLAVRRPDGTFVTTTSIAFPQKVANIRRDGNVAMLFSDPTASGVTGAPEVLVQGEATVAPDVAAGPAGTEDVWRRVYERQPQARVYGTGPVTRWLMDYYFMRLVITVTPTAVGTRPAVAGGTPLRPPAGAAAALAGYPTVVLGTRDDDGAPRLRRVRVADHEGLDLVLDLAGEQVAPGPASLLGHSHDENLWSLRNAVLLGGLDHSGGRWLFRPTRVAGGAESGSPVAQVRALRAWRRSAAAYLARRGLSRPRVAWAEFEEIKRSVS